MTDENAARENNNVASKFVINVRYIIALKYIDFENMTPPRSNTQSIVVLICKY
jgi:hypothetical protein